VNMNWAQASGDDREANYLGLACSGACVVSRTFPVFNVYCFSVRASVERRLQLRHGCAP